MHHSQFSVKSVSGLTLTLLYVSLTTDQHQDGSLDYSENYNSFYVSSCLA